MVYFMENHIPFPPLGIWGIIKVGITEKKNVVMSHLVVNCNISDFQVKSFTDGTFMVYAFDNAGNKVNMLHKSHHVY